MNTAMLFTLVAVAVAGLVWQYRRSRVNDGFTAAVMSKRRPEATICSPAQLIDGRNHIRVAVALEPRQIAYWNDDFDATVDINKIDEVEYASDLVTGGIADGAVLRLRAHGRAIEFVLDSAAAAAWSKQLPPHSYAQPGLA